MSKAAEMWDAAVSRLSKIRVLREDAPPPSDPEADLANTLSIWASDSACADHFLPWLEQRIEYLDIEEAANVRSHPDMLVAKGRRLEAKALRDLFLTWRGIRRQPPGPRE